MKYPRAYKRFAIDGMGIQCRLPAGAEVELLNLSPEGAYVIAEERLEDGQAYTLQVEHEDRSMAVTGIVESVEVTGPAISGSAGAGQRYIAGIRFGASADERTALREFIQASGENKTLRGRVRDLQVRPVIGHASPFACPVAQISFGGLQIESDKPLELDGQLQMEVLFPEDKRPMRLLARVASCRQVPETDPPRYRVGVEFLEMQTEDLLRLKEFIYFLEQA
jgi:class 3 adenylate cyclase